MDKPTEFLLHMQTLLGNEYSDFERAMDADRSFGLRINPLKMKLSEVDTIKESIGITGVIEWAKEGFFYNEEKRPGKSPYHEAGAFYIQEPSAMSVVEALDPKPGERICDLCAAPGGKTTHIAGRMQGQGILIANEIVTDRARILSKNVERIGVRNCVVTNEDPDTMASRFNGYFHRIVVDAPCSGEGMFRKEDIAVTEWSPENVRMCAERQKMILDCAEKMVMPGGTLVYSTCTFEPAEDEEIIGDFLKNHPDWHLVSTGLENILSKGCPQWMDNPNPEVEKCIRIWPHKNKGEGHFLAKLVKDGEYPILPQNDNENFGPDLKTTTDFQIGIKNKKNKKSKNLDRKGGQNRKTFGKEEVIQYISKLLPSSVLAERVGIDELYTTSDSIYLLPSGIGSAFLKGIHIIRPGLCLADICKDRLEPSHSLAMAVNSDEVTSFYDMSVEEAYKFMRGETINIQLSDVPNGEWVLMTVGNISLGWAKYVNGILKNHYPKGLRRN